MLIHKLARVLSALAIITLLGASCGGETAIEAGSAADTATEAAESDASDRTEPTAVPPTSAPEPTAVDAAPTPESAATGAETAEPNDQDQDATRTPADDDAIVLRNRDDAIAYIVSEGFVGGDAECIVDGAYQVFGTWDFAELDPDPDQDEELDGLLDACITVIPGPAAGSAPPGTDAELDALWVACNGGSATACDDLYWDAPLDSDYEAFGFSCGGRALDDCGDVLGDDSGDSASGDVDGPAAGSAPPGTDAELDALWVACDGGSSSACEDLFWQAPIDSDYEAFGLSCGGRTGDGFCSELLGDDSDDSASDEIDGPAAGSAAPGTDADLDVLWVACDGGSAEACDDLFWQAPVGSDYEAFGFSCGGRTASGSCSAVLDS